MEDNMSLVQIRTLKTRKEELKKIAKINGYTLNSLINKLIIDYIKKNRVKQWHLKKLSKS